MSDPPLEKQLREVVERGIASGVFWTGTPYVGDVARRLESVLTGQAPEQWCKLLELYSHLGIDSERCYGFGDPDGFIDIDKRNQDRQALGRVLPPDALVIMETCTRSVYLLKMRTEPTSPVYRIDPELMELSIQAPSVLDWLMQTVNGDIP